MLLINDDEAQTLEVHRVLDQGVGADEEVQLALCQLGQQHPPLLC